jgi:hypothetical protein
MKCTRCGRRLKTSGIQGMGPVCARAVLGAKPAKVKREDRRSNDARQMELLEDACQNA